MDYREQVMQSIKTLIIENDWQRAQSELDILTAVGEGKRIVAALQSAGRRHGWNVRLTAHKYHDPSCENEILDIILFSKDGVFTSRKYEIHIPLRLSDGGTVVPHTVEGQSAAMLVTTGYTGDDALERGYVYKAPMCASINALKWALVHIGQATAAEDDEVPYFDNGGYPDVADPKEKSIEEWVELGWWELGSAIQRALNSYVLDGRNLVLNYKFDEDKTDEDICPLCKTANRGFFPHHRGECTPINLYPDEGIASNPFADGDEDDDDSSSHFHHDGRGYPLPDRKWTPPAPPEPEPEPDELDIDSLEEWEKNLLQGK